VKVIRDARQETIRGDSSPYKCAENTAFAKILSGEKYYLSNDLEKEEVYENVGHDWRDRYNATIVVPIMKTYQTGSFDPREIIGFICADNKEGGFCTACVDLLRGSGTLLATILEAEELPVSPPIRDNVADIRRGNCSPSPLGLVGLSRSGTLPRQLMLFFCCAVIDVVILRRDVIFL